MQLLYLRLQALGHISGLLTVALLLTRGVVHVSLHGSLAIGPLVHLAIAQPPVDTLAGEISRVLAGYQYIEGPANLVADYLSHPLAMEGLHMVEDTIVHPVLTEWLSVVAPHLDLDSFILSGVATLYVSRLA